MRADEKDQKLWVKVEFTSLFVEHVRPGRDIIRSQDVPFGTIHRIHQEFLSSIKTYKNV